MTALCYIVIGLFVAIMLCWIVAKPLNAGEHGCSQSRHHTRRARGRASGPPPPLAAPPVELKMPPNWQGETNA